MGERRDGRVRSALQAFMIIQRVYPGRCPGLPWAGPLGLWEGEWEEKLNGFTGAGGLENFRC